MIAGPVTRLIGACALLLFLQLNGLAFAQELRINEFLASNSGGLRDQDGDSSDWIEIHNAGDSPVDLGGWHLTDDPGRLTLWTFPATNLVGGGYLVVFASGKDRAIAGAELHGNFQLSAEGEYLALVQPDGVTVAQQYAPQFPVQRANIAYGINPLTGQTNLITAETAARVWVPGVASELPADWFTPAFIDTSWMEAQASVGFDVGGSDGSLSMRVDINARSSGESGAADTELGWDTLTMSELPKVLDGVTISISPLGGATLEDRDRAVPADAPPGFTQDQLYDDFIFALGAYNGAGLQLDLEGLPPHEELELTVWSLDGAGSGGVRVSDWIETASGTTNVIADPYSYDQSVMPTLDGQDTFAGEVRVSESGQLRIEGRRSGGVNNGVYLNAFQLLPLGLGALIGVDIEDAMHGVNASAFLRIPFTVGELEAISALTLRMQYDDGFVAWLNGQQIASRNAPLELAWNSTATAERSLSEARQFETITVPLAFLVQGENVLAIQGLNYGAEDPDFLIVPELMAETRSSVGSSYFSPPTPGSPNGAGYPGFVAKAEFSVSRGFYDEPFEVSIGTATPDAEIRWTQDGSGPTPSHGTVYDGPIWIGGTSVVRAMAYRDGWLPSEVSTHTYLFLDQVLEQAADQPGYPSIWQASYPADYGMDPNVVHSAQYGPRMKQALLAIPALSVVTSHSNLWHVSNGIYNNATSEGSFWERPASIELIQPDGNGGFQVSCGVQMQGNASRDNVRTPKHAMRLLFKSGYGPGRFNYDWFGGGVDEFNTVVLRACFTDSWSTRYSDSNLVPGFTWRGQRYRPEDSLLLRDIWVKDTLRDMGWLSGRSAFVHLYLNGLYWGVYNPTERLDAEFFASHLGGRPEDWDVIRDFTELLDGSMSDWNQLMALVNAGINSEAAYRAVWGRVNVPNLIDYMILHIVAEAEDWPHHNWYAAHRRATALLPATPWIFLAWDQEIVLDQLVRRNRVEVNNDNTPARIYSQLRAWPEFRRLFGDRLHKHLFNDGALTPANNLARMTARAEQIDLAIVGESARWGDAREFAISPNIGHGQTFTRDEWWVPELQKLATNFFPRLSAENVARFRAAGLYPQLGAPEFSQFGGLVSAGFELTMAHANATGAIMYTLDGSDPRQYGSGGVVPAAKVYSGGIAFLAPTRVRARVFDGAQWSALVEADFYPPGDLSALAITEIMYNPPSLGGTDGGEFEFVELKNTGTQPLDLSGVHFSQGIGFAFPLGTQLMPGAFAVLGRNAAAFASKYPGVPLAGLFTARLSDSGETLALSDPTGATLASVSYGDRAPWPATADGWGFSLVPKTGVTSPGWGQAAQWRASTFPGGSPGANDPEAVLPGVRINEILAHTDPPLRDAVELYNPTGTEADIGGWWLSDDPSMPAKHRIEVGTKVPPGGYHVLDESQFNAVPGGVNAFGLSSTGDSIYLFSADGSGALTGYDHGVEFGASFNGESFGRHLNSLGEESFPGQTALSLGRVNAGPKVGPVIINEIHYHPSAGMDEFVEIVNIADVAVPLFHLEHPTNTWSVRGLAYGLPTGVTLAPGGILLLAPIDPALFRDRYDVPADVLIFGPINGVLQNDGERLELLAPDRPNEDVVPYVAVESVRYRAELPWPTSADGGGASLQRRWPVNYADDPANWMAALPTPGRRAVLLDSDGDGVPDDWELEHGTDPFVADAHLDPDEDGVNNLEEWIAGTDPRDPQSSLRLQWRGNEEVGWTLNFNAVAGRSYQLEAVPGVAPTDWSTIGVWPVSGADQEVIFPVDQFESAGGLYRLRVIMP